MDLAYTALFTVLLAVCTWISVPVPPVPFTLQTFAVFAALGTLGGRRGTYAVGAYLLLGLAGAPVFSGFQGGAGVLLGATGGYILGSWPRRCCTGPSPPDWGTGPPSGPRPWRWA